MKPDSARLPRPQDLLEYERRFWGRGLFMAGVDEAGRGPLAGPVVAAAVILPAGVSVDGADDSKQLSAQTREELYGAITSAALAFGVGAASVHEIDRRNILRATTVAMQRALDALDAQPDHIVVDGLPVKHLGREHDAVVGGDGIVHSIGCASILAKVVRDRLMQRLALRYPGYGWERNMGYGTAEHRAAIGELGLTPHHRLTFTGLQYALEL
ncbi:MAG: ribonuclease HII [Gemmatimonadales bacterium]|nr:ribonuclease HII [Gemmatimonadales bacterium]MBT4437096.1 ribonuclease HII [Gemmatimonadales bacterium]MBT4914673.1 ribonuclease HII [Gemmatimonadales bacterium]MBT6887557.1 ribonuclease HII [Gemmatimonadales bacterium]MBT7691622.1 ribonuclease HII [Gemmatimonadales bacterium]